MTFIQLNFLVRQNYLDFLLYNLVIKQKLLITLLKHIN